MTAFSVILEHGKSPAAWCEIFAGKGLAMSERTLRAKARDLGACHVVGKAMIITPDQIDRILEDCLCPSNHIGAARSGGPRDGSSSTVGRSPATSAKALAHLTKAARKTGSGRGRTGNVIALSRASSRGR